MNWRTFLTLASGGFLAGLPLAVEAQPTATVRKLVYVSFSPLPRFDASFNGSLRRLGWEEGRNVVVERRVAQSEATLADLAAEIVRLAPDVIVIPNAGIATVMRRATTTIPIVVLVAGDLVAPGLVETLTRPGRNVTELSPCSAVANQALAESSRPRWCHPPKQPQRGIDRAMC